jgi:hypothetical protein
MSVILLGILEVMFLTVKLFSYILNYFELLNNIEFPKPNKFSNGHYPAERRL